MVYRRTVSVAAALAALVLNDLSAEAAEKQIDAFIDASAQTQFIANTNVKQAAVGSTTRNDPNLNGVIGGDRTLTVGAATLTFPGADFVVAGISLGPVAFFEYNSTSEADGSAALLYDDNGSGLNAFLAFAMGISVEILDADLAAVTPGLDVTLTLTDGDLVPVSATQTVTMPVSPMAPLALQFPFSSFPGIDPSNIFSIRIAIDPGEGADLRLGAATTFGTPLQETACDDGIDNDNNGFIDCADRACANSSPDCPSQAPALSPLGVAFAFVTLSLIGLGALARLRRRV